MDKEGIINKIKGYVVKGNELLDKMDKSLKLIIGGSLLSLSILFVHPILTILFILIGIIQRMVYYKGKFNNDV